MEAAWKGFYGATVWRDDVKVLDALLGIFI